MARIPTSPTPVQLRFTGEDGITGQGFEPLYRVAARDADPTTFAVPSNTRPYRATTDQGDGWHSEPQDPTEANPIQYWVARLVPGIPAIDAVPPSGMTERLVIGWGDWSSVAKFSGIGEQGRQGEQGIPGIAGSNGRDGADGQPGEDGKFYEYIYAVHPDASLNTNQLPDNSWGYDQPVARNGVTWTDGLSRDDITATNPFAFESRREVPATVSDGDAVSASWSSPAVVSRYGQDGARGPQGEDGRDGIRGADGKFYEYIYAIHTGRILNTNQLPDNNWGYDQPVARNGVTWTDGLNRQDITSTNPFAFESRREVPATVSTGVTVSANWSSPYVVSRYGQDGERGPAGADGRDGQRGADGKFYEYIYAVRPSRILDTNQLPDNSWGFDQPTERNGVTWTDGLNRNDITNANPIAFESRREVSATVSVGDAVSANWSVPVVVSELPDTPVPFASQIYNFQTIKTGQWAEQRGNFKFVASDINSNPIQTFSGINNDIRVALVNLDRAGKKINWDFIPVNSMLTVRFDKESQNPREAWIAYRIIAVTRVDRFPNTRILRLRYVYQGMPRTNDSIAGLSNYWFEFGAQGVDEPKTDSVYAATAAVNIVLPSNDWGFAQGGVSTRTVNSESQSTNWQSNPSRISNARALGHNFIWKAERKYTGEPQVGDPVEDEWTTPEIIGIVANDRVDIDAESVEKLIDLVRPAFGDITGAINNNGEFALTEEYQSNADGLEEIEDITGASSDLYLWIRTTERLENILAGTQVRYSFANGNNINSDLVFYQNFNIVSVQPSVINQATGLNLYVYRVDHLGAWVSNEYPEGGIKNTGDVSHRVTFYQAQIPPTPTGAYIQKDTNNTLTLNWDDVEDIDGYKVRYKAITDTEWTEVTVPL